MLTPLFLPDGTEYSLSYESWGDASSPHVLFCVHGLTRNAMDFEKIAMAATARGFHVVAPDMPGRGKSTNLSNPLFYNNAVNAALCIQLLANLGLSRVHWLGTSMGGMIAMLVANQAPTVIQKLVLNDVGCVITGASIKRIGEYLSHNPSFATFGAAERLLRERTRAFSIPEPEWPRFAETSITQDINGFRLAYDAAIAASFALPEPIADIQLWPLWEAVKPIPTLLIRGTRSDLLTEETAALMASTHPELTRYNVENTGHAPALMTQAEITAILDFISYPGISIKV